MKICGLVAVISISATPACTLRNVNLYPNTTNSSALEMPIFTHCNASAFWLPGNKKADDLYPDCHAATMQFLGVATEHGRAVYEFHAADVRKWPQLPSITTPLKYVYQSCMILITNLHDLPRELLPLFAQRKYPATTQASYHDIFDAVDSAMTSCMESARMQRRLGWAVQGRLAVDGAKGGLGVFLIGRGSAFDRAVPVVRELDIDSDRGRQVQDASS